RSRAVLLLRFAWGIVDADADDLFRLRNWRQPCRCFQCMIGRAAGRAFGEPHQGTCGDHLSQSWVVLAMTRGEIDDAGIDHCAVFDRTVEEEGCKASGAHQLQSETVTSATNCGSRTCWPV